MQVVEAPLNAARIWVEFDDPAITGQRFRCDLTWLTSNWRCLYGDGCRGIYADRPHDGCCTMGAHFTDGEDLDRVAEVVDRLDPDIWQYHAHADATSGALDRWTEVDADGTRKTRRVDGACVFLNRVGFPTGAGCALHVHGVLTGVAPHEVKPDVCWQLPIRRSYRTVDLPDASSYLEVSISEFDRRAWGPGGHDLDWYCSGDSIAHTNREPVYRSLREELVELMGAAAYAELEARCAAYLRTVQAARATGRNLLPLYVHPATLEATAAAQEQARREQRRAAAARRRAAANARRAAST